jgi:C-terminal processing protease CtpA/Prc
MRESIDNKPRRSTRGCSGSLGPRRTLPFAWASCTLLLAAALVAGAGSAQSLDARAAAKLGSKLTRQIDRCLSRSAYVHGTSFDDWSTRAAGLSGDFAAARDHAGLARRINRELDLYGVSHLRLATPAGMEVRAAGLELGPGLRLVPAVGGYVVSLVYPDAPAAAAGVHRGDLVVAIDGRSVSGDGVRPVAADVPDLLQRRRLLVAPQQTRRLTVLREGTAAQLQFEVGAATYRAALPFSIERRGDLAWLTLSSFRSEVYDRELIRESFRALVTDPPALGLVVDVRSNGGGRLSNLFHFVSHLLPDQSVVNLTVDRKAARRGQRRGLVNLADLATAQRISKEAGIPTFLGPVVVLIDNAAGSGGDLLPAVLRDLGRAQLIGTTTAGMLLGGTWCKLSEGFQLVFPVSEILPPSGRRVEGVGVVPDVVLSPKDSARDDRVEAEARSLLQRLSATAAPASGVH